MNLSVENNLGVDLQSAIMVLVATLIIILIAKKYFWNVIVDYMEKRKAFIEGEYQKAQAVNEEANLYKQQYENKIANANEEVNKLLVNGKQLANNEYQAILNKARQDADNLIVKANEEIAYEKRKASEEMNNKIKDVAFSAAEKLIKENIRNEAKDQFVDEFIREVNG